MDSALQWIEGNLALLMTFVILLMILNLLVIFILTSRLAELRQEIKALSLGSYSWRQATSADLEQSAEMQSQQVSASKATDHGLPSSLLIEKAIAQIKLGTPVDQIQADLGIDDHYLEILIKQHKP
jgi:hypothetical protein